MKARSIARIPEGLAIPMWRLQPQEAIANKGQPQNRPVFCCMLIIAFPRTYDDSIVELSIVSCHTSSISIKHRCLCEASPAIMDVHDGFICDGRFVLRRSRLDDT